MPPRAKKLIPAALVLLLIGIWYGLRPRPDLTLIGEVTATRILYNGEATPGAHVTVPFTRKDDRYTIANVAIDLNKDGKFAAYAVTGGTQEEWIVKNSRAKVIEGGDTFSFDLVDGDVPTRNQFHLVALLTEKPIEGWDGGVRRGSAASEATIPAFKTEDFGGLFTADPENGGAGGILGAAPAPAGAPAYPDPTTPRERFTTKHPEAYMTDASASGGDVPGAAAVGAAPAADAPPAAGSDFEVFQPGVPDRFQAHNECVPSSISNGLHWLAKRYGFEDKLPDAQEKTMNELKPDLGWSLQTGANMRDDVLPAKVAFTERHGLPIYSHRIGGTLDPDILGKIAVELKKGQAVEVAIGYYVWNEAQAKWERTGGHMMSGVGAFGSNGRTYLGVHDPLSPESGALDIYQVDGARLFNYRYRGTTSVFIEWAYAQSPKAEWVAAHPPQAALDVSGVETANLQDAWFIEMLNIGTAWYPAKQFHKGTGPECQGAEHWHANTGTAWGLEFRNSGNYFETNPERIRAREAPLAEWTDPEGCGAGKTPDVKLYNVMISREEASALVSKIVR
ncbi:MAG TPA: hypothetical protein VL283_00060 [Candidatus Baltobacteraceae bacterium]|nr:hypothetical protein [Candidatus Baltobacteraceae bacterium]